MGIFNKAKVISKGLVNQWTPDHKYFNLMMYPEYIDHLPIEEYSILIESQQGKDFDGNVYHVLRGLVQDPAFDNYKIYLVAKRRSQAMRKVRRAMARLKCSDRCVVVKLWSQEYFKAVATCKYLINDNTWASYFIKRNEQVYINTWHGTPLKTLGRGDKHGMHAIGNAQKNFLMADYLLYPNEYTRDVMIRDYMLENICKSRVLVHGYPRNTVLVDNYCRDSIRSELGATGKKIYIYMPTWRSNSDPNFMSSVLDNMDMYLKRDEIMYLKMHPVERKRISLKKYNRIKFLPESYDLYEMLSASDGLITDYSSVMFDYALMNKPIALFTYDAEEYAEERGMYMSIDELPWRHSDALNEVIDAVRDPDNVADEKWLERFCPYDEPDATRKLLHRTILGEDTGIIEEDIPSNGLPNVLIYTGELSRNGVTSSLKSLLSKIDTKEKNYYLTFNSTAVAPNIKALQEFSDDIKYISIVGKMNTTFEEKKALVNYDYRWENEDRLLACAEKLFKRDIRRNYFDIEFESVVQYSGYAYKKILEFSFFDANRIIYVHNDMMREIETRGVQRLEMLEYAYGTYDKVVCVSESVKDATVQLIKNSRCPDESIDRLCIVENTFDIERIRSMSELPLEFADNTRCNVEYEDVQKILDSDSKIFVNIARYSREKGHDRLLDAFNTYWKTHRDSYLICIGGNQMHNIYEYLIERKLPTIECASNVVLLLRMDNPFTILKRADGFILSSFYEGFGLVVAEADILGVPVVSTDIDGPKIFLTSHGGTLVENSYEGIIEGFKLLGEGRVDTLDMDYEKYNRNCIKSFNEIINCKNSNVDVC